LVVSIIEKNGIKKIVTEKVIGYNEIDMHIKVYENMLSNIERNLQGLQEQRTKIMTKLQKLREIKDSIQEGAGLTDPAPESAESQSLPVG